MKKFFKNIWGWIINIWKIMMEFISPVLAIANKVFKKVFGTVVVLSFTVIPFLNNVINHTTAHWLWYPVLTLILISLVMGWFHKLKPVFDSPIVEFARKWGKTLAVFATISVFVFNYYDIDKKWLWVIFVYMAIYTPCFFLSLLVFDVKQNGKDVEKHQNAFANVVKNIALYWFVDLFYMSVFNYWIIYIENQTFNTTWLSLQFVFGILSLVIITFNLTQVFLNGQKSLWFFIALELVIALITCGYLIFIIPNCNIQEIVLTIVSALIGGILTLVGVAWTIKDTNEKRQKDIERIENEHKEDERKRYVPFINLYTNEVLIPDHNIDVSNLTFSASSECKRFMIEPFCLRNTDFTAFCLAGIYFNNHVAQCKPASYIDKQWIVKISLEEELVLPEDLFALGVYAKDLLGNEYRIPLDFNVNKTENPVRVIPVGSCMAEYINSNLRTAEGKNE